MQDVGSVTAWTLCQSHEAHCTGLGGGWNQLNTGEILSKHNILSEIAGHENRIASISGRWWFLTQFKIHNNHLNRLKASSLTLSQPEDYRNDWPQKRTVRQTASLFHRTRCFC